MLDQAVRRRATTTETLADAIIGAMPRLAPDEQRLAVAIYRRMTRARPVRLRDAAVDAGIDPARTDEIVAGWHGVYRDDAGDVVGFWGLALEDMPHQLAIGGHRITTWCAWDPLFIVPLLDERGEVGSRDVLSGRAISLAVSRAGVEALRPQEAVVSFRSPAEPWDDTVIRSFCHDVLFFADRASGERWTRDHPDTFLVSVGDAFEVGRLVVREVFGALRAKLAESPHGG